jgi:hypothetical protein
MILKMNNPRSATRAKSGFTIIEALVFLFIFALTAVTFYSVFALGTRYIIESKVRLVADALANERMEIVRNLDYDDIGLQSGIPAGNLPGTETVSRSGRSFYIFTNVRYVDDSYDRLEADSPPDPVATDYKQVRIKVAWENNINTNKAVVVVSDFAPPKKETPIGGGTLAINVLDKNGAGISQVTVHISNPGEGISFTDVTDETGTLSYPGAPADDQDYIIEISKGGYYSAHTYAPYPNPPYNFDPVDEHAAVNEGRTNLTAIITDHDADFAISTEDPFGTAVFNVDFNLEGGRKLGDTVPGGIAVYDYNQDSDSGSGGSVNFEDMSYGPYKFIPDAGITDYELIKLDNGASSNQDFEIEPADDISIKAIFADKFINSLLAKVQTSADSSAIEGATVRLKNDGLGYDATVPATDKFGQAYFPLSLPELTAGTYELIVNATGYQEKTENVDINDLTRHTVSLDEL